MYPGISGAEGGFRGCRLGLLLVIGDSETEWRRRTNLLLGCVTWGRWAAERALWKAKAADSDMSNLSCVAVDARIRPFYELLVMADSWAGPNCEPNGQDWACRWPRGL